MFAKINKVSEAALGCKIAAVNNSDVPRGSGDFKIYRIYVRVLTLYPIRKSQWHQETDPIFSTSGDRHNLQNTLKCLSIGTPKAINFPFVSNEKLMIFRCPNIQAHYNEAVIYLNFGTPKNNEFSIWNKWKIYYF